MEAGDILSYYSCCMVADTANKAAALYYNVHRLRYKEFYAAAEGVDFDFFVLCNSGISQVHTDTATESVETGTMEWLATIDVLITAVMHTTADALTVFTNRQRTLEPLVWVAAITVDNH